MLRIKMANYPTGQSVAILSVLGSDWVQNCSAGHTSQSGFPLELDHVPSLHITPENQYLKIKTVTPGKI